MTARARSGSQKRQRQRVVSVRLTEAEYEALQERARLCGLAVGAYVRACAFGDTGPRALRAPPVERELLAAAVAQLGKLGSNVNQIARALHRFGTPDYDGMEQARQ